MILKRPKINCVRDHFDKEVEASLRRDLPIITTPHAKAHLECRNEDPFTRVFSVDHFEKIGVSIEGADGSKQPQLRVIGMPGKHVPPNGMMEKFNDIVKAVSIHVSSSLLLLSLCLIETELSK